MITNAMGELRAGHIVLDRYELQERIGRGGFSTVYRAYDAKMDRMVAIKVVPRADELTERATREAHVAARLSHPHIVTIFELSEDQEDIYLVTELIEGRTLSEYIGTASLSDRDSLEVALQVLEALGHAHQQGVVHRDIKPDNVMLSDRHPFHVKVMDFGIAQLEDTSRITRQGDVIGTLAYMSPEQADGYRVDGATDVYSTAITLYECLAGSNPFRAATAAETLGRIHAGAPPLSHVRPDLPQELSDILEDASQPDPSMRLGRASFATALEDLLPQVRGGDRETTILRHAGGSRLLGPWTAGEKLSFLGARAANAALAALVAWVAVSAASLYPEAWTLPTVAALAVAVGIVPRLGLAALAAVAAAPVLVFSPVLGAMLAVVLGAYYFAVALRRPMLALLPALAAMLGYAGAGLAYPGISGALGRLLRGAVLAAAGALAFTFYQLVSGAATLDYVGVANSFDLPQSLAGENNPLAMIDALLLPFREQPVLALQPVIWLLAAVPAALLIRRRRLDMDLAGLALSVSALAGGYLALPYLVTGYSLPLAAFMKTLAVCVIIQCVLLLLSPRAGLQPPSSYEHTEETRG